MLTTDVDHSAKITALINAVAVLFSLLPTEKQKEALHTLQGLSTHIYKPDEQHNAIRTEKSEHDAYDAIKEGYIMIIDAMQTFSYEKQ